MFQATEYLQTMRRICKFHDECIQCICEQYGDVYKRQEWNHLHRWYTDQTGNTKEPASGLCHGFTGYLAFYGHDPGKYRLWASGSNLRTGGRGCKGSAYPRIHPVSYTHLPDPENDRFRNYRNPMYRSPFWKRQEQPVPKPDSVPSDVPDVQEPVPHSNKVCAAWN